MQRVIAQDSTGHSITENTCGATKGFTLVKLSKSLTTAMCYSRNTTQAYKILPTQITANNLYFAESSAKTS